ncbi:hypothetical protein ECP26DNA_00001 [Escherichia phage vB_EcoM-ECP26]|uniref:Uncharacterized protein n=1 Tax=Escherichia phage vB_EcoM-ECP26 TaxID=2576873 RepID=A0A4Y5TVQ4_9CAUD|nr:hypothetical protein ECP26DNA_00001 [Escherichia phage vB_EcoM-ECP26]
MLVCLQRDIYDPSWRYGFPLVVNFNRDGVLMTRLKQLITHTDPNFFTTLEQVIRGVQFRNQ